MHEGHRVLLHREVDPRIERDLDPGARRLLRLLIAHEGGFYRSRRFLESRCRHPDACVLMFVRVVGFLLLAASVAVASREQDAVAALIRATGDKDRGVRYAAVQALGKARAGMGRVVALLEDEEWCVRQAAGRAIEEFGDAAVPELLRVFHSGSPAARLEALEALSWIGSDSVPWLVAALDEKDSEIVLEALYGLWRHSAAPVPKLVELLAHDDNEVRLLAAIQLKQAAPDHGTLADRTLTDVMICTSGRVAEWAEEWLDRQPPEERRPADTSGEPDPPFAMPRLPSVEVTGFRARLRAVRAATDGAGGIAPLLAHPNPVMSLAAARALMRMGEEAAVPVVDQIRTGHFGVLHYAPEIFEALGAFGDPAVEPLAELLGHPNVHVRECAARCLAAIGPDGERASGALVKALADRRLPVVSHAALALGRIGITRALIEGTRNDRARVRAYCAFALGWAFGELRGVDQVIYERRLPVLDCGESGPFPSLQEVAILLNLPEIAARRLARRGLGSPDPRIAIPCAAVFEYDHLDAWEMERCVELLIPDGFRMGSAADFDNVRGYLGSSELPALLEYFVRSQAPGRRSIYGDLHRSARAENLPALCWFERTEGARSLDGIDALWQPAYKTLRHHDLLVRHWLGREGSAEDLLRRGGYVAWWWMDRKPLTAEQSGWVLRNALERQGDQYPSLWWDCLRMLGRARDAGSRRYLREIAKGAKEPADFALASLAQRGFADATAELVERSRGDHQALGLLVDVRPDVARGVLLERLCDPAQAAACARLLLEAAEDSYVYGLVWRPEVFDGIEAVLPLDRLNAAALADIAEGVPGCRTHRLAAALMERMEQDPETEWPGWTVADVLYLQDPERTLALLRRWAARSGEFSLALARVGGPEDAANALLGVEWEGEWLARYPDLELPEEASYLARVQQQGAPPAYPSDEELLPLIKQGKAMEVARAILTNDPNRFWYRNPVVREDWMLDHLRGCFARRDAVSSALILPLMATWPDEQARIDHWSILRAGRHFWIYSNDEAESLTLGLDASTLPFWIDELESNCCRIAGGPESIWEDHLGLRVLYGCESSGVGEPPARRVRQWFERNGGDMIFSPLSQRWVAKLD
jgi:HEAT repeat protein